MYRISDTTRFSISQISANIIERGVAPESGVTPLSLYTYNDSIQRKILNYITLQKSDRNEVHFAIDVLLLANHRFGKANA